MGHDGHRQRSSDRGHQRLEHALGLEPERLRRLQPVRGDGWDRAGTGGAGCVTPARTSSAATAGVGAPTTSPVTPPARPETQLAPP